MDYATFARDAGHKRRTVADLARFISTRTDNNPNYTLLFGAGCSITSGIRSATQLVSLWRQEIYKACAKDKADFTATAEMQRAYLQAHESTWYDQAREYSSLFEKRYDLQRQRRMFVESEVSGKTPSIGYAYLTSLVEQNFFGTIFTTNFDDILNEAFYAYSTQRPIVCAHDSSINSITVTSKRPKIIKLHGDYLFDDIKSTMRETENLEQNIKAKFMEFAKDYGLIVVGYAGGDRSVMDTLAALLRNEELLKNGVYWCLRPDTEVSEELRKLIWRDRVYFVEIEGFDELFAELYCSFNDGEVLPKSASSIVQKSHDVATRLLESPTAFPTTTATLRAARERLERRSRRTSLVNLLAGTRDDGSAPNVSDGLEDEEVAVLAEVQNHLAAGEYEDALRKAGQHLKRQCSLPLKIRLLTSIGDAHRALDQLDRAQMVADELIKLIPNNASPYLYKAELFVKYEEQLECIDKAVEANPYSVAARRRRAALFASEAARHFGNRRQELFDKAKADLDCGIKLNRGWSNSCWPQLYDLIEEVCPDKQNRRPALEKLVADMEEQHPLSSRLLLLKVRLLKEDDAPSRTRLLQDLQVARARLTPDYDQLFDLLRLRVLSKSKELDSLSTFSAQLAQDAATYRAQDLCRDLARVYRCRFGDDEKALTILRRCLETDFDSDVFTDLVFALSEIGQISEARAVFARHERKISERRRSSLLAEIYESEGDLDAAYQEVRRRKVTFGVKFEENEPYLLIRLGRDREAEELLREYLQPINFTPEATQEIINYELARKRRGDKPSADRLGSVLKFAQDDKPVAAAVNALLGKRADVIASVKASLEEDRTLKYDFRRWPVFDEWRKDVEIRRLIDDPVSSNVVEMKATA